MPFKQGSDKMRMGEGRERLVGVLSVSIIPAFRANKNANVR